MRYFGPSQERERERRESGNSINLSRSSGGGDVFVVCSISGGVGGEIESFSRGVEIAAPMQLEWGRVGFG